MIGVHLDSPADKKLISIACLCYNEIDNIERAYKKILWLIEQCPQYDFEIVVADNGSTDGSQEKLRDIAREDDRFKVILNASNFGVERSSANLLSNLSGDAYISYPIDMQEPIEVLPEMLQYWESGYDVVWGQKTSSDESKAMYLLRSFYYAILNFCSYNSIPRQVTGYGVVDRVVLRTILQCKTQDPSISSRILIPEYGFKTKLVPYKQNKRQGGKSSYNFGRYVSSGLNILCGNSTKPLRIMMFTGLGLAFVSLLIALAFAVIGLINPPTIISDLGFILLMNLFVLGALMFCIGFAAEYTAIASRKVTSKVIVIEKERLNFADNTPKVLVGGTLSHKYDVGVQASRVSSINIDMDVRDAK